MSDATRVPDEWVEAGYTADRRIYGLADREEITAVIAAVAPLIRRAVAEEIAGAVEPNPDRWGEDDFGRGLATGFEYAATVARRHAEAP